MVDGVAVIPYANEVIEEIGNQCNKYVKTKVKIGS